MITYTEKGIWLHDAIQAAGHEMYNLDGVWRSDDDVAVQQIIDGFDPLPFARTDAIEDLKAKASEHILLNYPLYAQMNMSMRATELQEKRFAKLQSLTTAEGAEKAALEASAARITSIRAASKSVENTINTETDWTRCKAHADTGKATIEAL